MAHTTTSSSTGSTAGRGGGLAATATGNNTAVSSDRGGSEVTLCDTPCGCCAEWSGGGWAVVGEVWGGGQSGVIGGGELRHIASWITTASQEAVTGSHALHSHRRAGPSTATSTAPRRASSDWGHQVPAHRSRW